MSGWRRSWISSCSGRAGGGFDAIRRRIAKELHPDSCRAEEQGKELLTQMFQRIRPQIQEISRELR
jgi:hypothetical protein